MNATAPRAVSWPSPGDYTDAIQNPANCFLDASLKKGRVTTSPLGLPLAASGNFAVAYELKSGRKTLAVRCFIRPVVDHQQRYQALSDHLRRTRLPSLVDFSYVPSGVRVRGREYPIVLMEWVSGRPFHLFVEEHLEQRGALEALATHFWQSVKDLQSAHLAHGDLQHGNIIVDDRRSIRLVDYDGFYTPAMEGRPPTEVGHPNFQHPARLTGGHYAETADSFSALVIGLSLLALAAEPVLWSFHNRENLILTSKDYKQPGATPIWKRLEASPDARVRELSAKLRAFCRGPVQDIPDLASILGNSGRRPRLRRFFSVSGLRKGIRKIAAAAILASLVWSVGTWLAPKAGIRFPWVEDDRAALERQLIRAEERVADLRRSLVDIPLTKSPSPWDDVSEWWTWGANHAADWARMISGTPETMQIPELGVEVDTHETTNLQFVRFLNAMGNRSEGDSKWILLDNHPGISQRGGHFVVGEGYSEHPVVQVSWYAARAYCDWVDKRLPSVAEWRQACQGNDLTDYPWGRAFDDRRGNFADHGSTVSRRDAGTAPVGSFPEGASPYGVLDMAGNVWEWSSTNRDGAYFMSGGGYNSDRSKVDCYSQESHPPHLRLKTVGFRCIR